MSLKQLFQKFMVVKPQPAKLFLLIQRGEGETAIIKQSFDQNELLKEMNFDNGESVVSQEEYDFLMEGGNNEW